MGILIDTVDGLSKNVYQLIIHLSYHALPQIDAYSMVTSRFQVRCNFLIRLEFWLSFSSADRLYRNYRRQPLRRRNSLSDILRNRKYSYLTDISLLITSEQMHPLLYAPTQSRKNLSSQRLQIGLLHKSSWPCWRRIVLICEYEKLQPWFQHLRNRKYHPIHRCPGKQEPSWD